MLPDELSEIQIMHILLRLQYTDPVLFTRTVSVLKMSSDERSKIADNFFMIAPDRYFILLDEMSVEDEVVGR